MFKPNTDKEWLMKIIELEGDGFANAGGILDKYPEDETDEPPQNPTFEKSVELEGEKTIPEELVTSD